MSYADDSLAPIPPPRPSRLAEDRVLRSSRMAQIAPLSKLPMWFQESARTASPEANLAIASVKYALYECAELVRDRDRDEYRDRDAVAWCVFVPVEGHGVPIRNKEHMLELGQKIRETATRCGNFFSWQGGCVAMRDDHELHQFAFITACEIAYTHAARLGGGASLERFFVAPPRTNLQLWDYQEEMPANQQGFEDFERREIYRMRMITGALAMGHMRPLWTGPSEFLAQKPLRTDAWMGRFRVGMQKA